MDTDTCEVHAMLWSGTAASFIDLHSFLPEGRTNSVARGIDSEGNIVGYADGQAVMWTVTIPASGTVILAALGTDCVS